MDNSKEFQVMLDEAIRVEPDGFRNFDRTKNAQSQLQDMIVNPPVKGRLYDFYTFVHEEVYFPTGIFHKHRGLEGDEACHYFDSMEQLWLAFVQKELHQKQWNGSEWITT